MVFGLVRNDKVVLPRRALLDSETLTSVDLPPEIRNQRTQRIPRLENLFCPKLIVKEIKQTVSWLSFYKLRLLRKFSSCETTEK